MKRPYTTSNWNEDPSIEHDDKSEGCSRMGDGHGFHIMRNAADCASTKRSKEQQGTITNGNRAWTKRMKKSHRPLFHSETNDSATMSNPQAFLESLDTLQNSNSKKCTVNDNSEPSHCSQNASSNQTMRASSPIMNHLRRAKSGFETCKYTLCQIPPFSRAATVIGYHHPSPSSNFPVLRSSLPDGLSPIQTSEMPELFRNASTSSTPSVAPTALLPHTPSYMSPLEFDSPFMDMMQPLLPAMQATTSPNQQLLTAPICCTPREVSIPGSRSITRTENSAFSQWKLDSRDSYVMTCPSSEASEDSQVAAALLPLQAPATYQQIPLEHLVLTPGMAKAMRSSVAYQTERRILGTIEVTTKPCRCKNTHCLKLYCTCFQAGVLCSDELCLCSQCKNVASENHSTSSRAQAIREILDRRLDAFEERTKRNGGRCSCKKNR
jgi:hypothetical protein